MEYNTSSPPLVFREYGRNIQQLVDHAITIEDRKERNLFAREIIKLMGQMHPHLKNVEEFRHKLWHQLFIISDYRLDIDSPYPMPTREEVQAKPKPAPYPQVKLRFKHYGKNVEKLIEKAVTMKDKEKKQAFAKVIANYMKMVYRNWNRDGVSDELIKSDLMILSDNQLAIAEDEVLEVPKQNNSNHNNSNGRSSGRQGYRKNNNGGKRNYNGNGRHNKRNKY